MTDKTKLPQLDRIIPFCQVVSIPTGSVPKNIIVQLPGEDGARVPARWYGDLAITTNDYVRLQRRGHDGQFDVVGTDGATVGSTGFWPGPNQIRIGANIYSTLASAASASASGDTVLIGPGTFTYGANVTFTSGVKAIVGSGIGVTILSSTAAATIAATNTVFMNMTISHAVTGAALYCLDLTFSTAGRYWLVNLDLQVTALTVGALRIQGSQAGASIYMSGGRYTGTFHGLINQSTGQVYIFNNNSFEGGSATDVNVDTGATCNMYGPVIVNGTLTITGTVKGWYFHLGQKSVFRNSDIPPWNITERNSAPAGPYGANDIYVDDGTNLANGRPGFKRYDGAAWEALDGGAIATETIKGDIEIATQSETDTGTNDTNAITPLKLKTTPINHLKVSKLVAPDGNPDPALSVDIAGDLTAVGSLIMADGKLVGLGTSAGRITFSDAALDLVQVQDARLTVTLPSGQSIVLIAKGTNAAGQVNFEVENDASADTANSVNQNFVLQTSTSRRSAGNMKVSFSTTTDASRTSLLEFQTANNGAFATRLAAAGNNIGINTTAQFGSGAGVIGIANASTNPSTNPTNGHVLYSDAGALKGRGSGGTTTTIAAAEPHCPNCGRDFVLEWTNEEYGHLIVCVWCLTEGKAKGVVKRDGEVKESVWSKIWKWWYKYA